MKQKDGASWCIFHYFMATGIHANAVAKEFPLYDKEEQEHADRIAARIRQLGGKPEMDPTDSHTRRLYFADEIPEHSDASQEIHA